MVLRSLQNTGSSKYINLEKEEEDSSSNNSSNNCPVKLANCMSFPLAQSRYTLIPFLPNELMHYAVN